MTKSKRAWFTLTPLAPPNFNTNAYAVKGADFRQLLLATSLMVGGGHWQAQCRSSRQDLLRPALANSSPNILKNCSGIFLPVLALLLSPDD
jgi:hypothetical protein